MQKQRVLDGAIDHITAWNSWFSVTGYVSVFSFNFLSLVFSIFHNASLLSSLTICMCTNLQHFSIAVPVKTVYEGPAWWLRGKRQVVFPFSFSIPLPVLHNVFFLLFTTLYSYLNAPCIVLPTKSGLLCYHFPFTGASQDALEKARDVCCTIIIIEKWHDKQGVLSSTSHMYWH